MTIPARLAFQLAGLWLFLVVVSLLCRTYIPIDETRYVTVAWNMWLRNDFLVPYLNGEPYSHKPPLLFWLMNMGWAVFGVNDWWPRLVPSFFSLGSAWLTYLLAGRLWPQEKEVSQIAPIILLGSFLWTVFTTATMFDMLVAFFTLLGLLGILIAWMDRPFKGWLLISIAISGGLLAKGPTILLQILPLAILAPWWGRVHSQSLRHWYLGLLGATVVGTMITLAWAVPAGLRGGATYQHAIFWGQTADRMVQSFAHRHPLWWYVPLLPGMLFPWLFWVPIWRAAIRLKHASSEMGVRFCLAWLLPVFIAFSLISGKQVHYLLPIFPAFSLLAARGLGLVSVNSRWDVAPVVLATLSLGGVLLYLPFYAQNHQVASWLEDIPAWGGLTMIGGGAALLITHGSDRLAAAWKMALFSAFVVTIIYVAIIREAGSAYDVHPISARLKKLQDAGVPLVHDGKYPGIFNFIGRMKNSPQISTLGNLNAWFKANPNGRAIVYFNHAHPVGDIKPEFIQYFLGNKVAIVNREQWREWWDKYQYTKVKSDNDDDIQ